MKGSKKRFAERFEEQTSIASLPKTLMQSILAVGVVQTLSKLLIATWKREVVRRNRNNFVKTMEEERGRADPELVAEYERLFS